MPITQQQADDALRSIPRNLKLTALGLQTGKQTKRIIITERTLQLLVDIYAVFKPTGSINTRLPPARLASEIETYRTANNIPGEMILNNGIVILCMLMAGFKFQITKTGAIYFNVALKTDQEKEECNRSRWPMIECCVKMD